MAGHVAVGEEVLYSHSMISPKSNTSWTRCPNRSWYEWVEYSFWSKAWSRTTTIMYRCEKAQHVSVPVKCKVVNDCLSVASGWIVSYGIVNFHSALAIFQLLPEKEPILLLQNWNLPEMCDRAHRIQPNSQQNRLHLFENCSSIYHPSCQPDSMTTCDASKCL